MTLYVYNTLSKRQEPFKPLEPDKVKIYTCGLTANDYMHVGHARTYVVWDVAVRYLRYLGFVVQHVSNVTDESIDDRFLKRVRELGISFQQLVNKFTNAYFEDRYALSVLPADVHPLVTQHIQEIIEAIQKLVEKGYAYKTEDGVYYSIKKFRNYGRLAGIKVSKLKAGVSSRVKTDEYEKEAANDFALWKKAKPGEPYWYSPWGRGRPGWHIECSVLALKYLGESIDIHAGGEDNIFQHHENEIAQSEALTDKPFSRYWLHTRHVFLNEQRMSKSLKNYITAREAVNKYGAVVLRFHLLTTHYRSLMDFKEDELAGSKTRLEKLKDAVWVLRSFEERGLEKTKPNEKALLQAMTEAEQDFKEAMNDDFNTPLAINAVMKLAGKVLAYTEAYEDVSKSTAKKLSSFFKEIGTILLGDLFEREIEPKTEKQLEALVEMLLAEREKARKRGDYKTADSIREELQTIGIHVEDTKQGSKWRFH